MAEIPEKTVVLVEFASTFHEESNYTCLYCPDETAPDRDGTDHFLVSGDWSHLPDNSVLIVRSLGNWINEKGDTTAYHLWEVVQEEESNDEI
jgi:hypothetical protein